MRKIIICLSAIISLLSPNFTYASTPLSDINGHPSEVAINYLYGQGIINGNGDGTFLPERPLNRAELVKILTITKGDNVDPRVHNNCFPDIQDQWFAPYVCYAKAQGWVQGYPDGYFRPEKHVNRAEAIKILVVSQGFTLPAVTYEPYLDVNSGDWFAPYIEAAYIRGLINGRDNFYPGSEMKRAHMAEVIYRLLTGGGVVTPSPTPVENPNAFIPNSSNSITAIWANEGGDKVIQDELRATRNSNGVLNSVWNGENISIFGAKNEIVNFNLVLEAANQNAGNINVEFNQLIGPNNYKIASAPINKGEDYFNWTNRNIELFYVRYLEVKGLSAFCCNKYDERHIPEKLRRPYDLITGIANGTWYNRPNANKFYPDIAVPLELEQNFTIGAGKNQSIWADIFIPKEAPAGYYSGKVTITQNNQTISEIPVTLEVKNFTLPDIPTAKTMVYYSRENINHRYTGIRHPIDPAQISFTEKLYDQHFKMAHRHKVSLIDADYTPNNQPSAQWIKRLNGTLFTAANGYNGPGIGQGNGIYSIGTYGGWTWKDGGQAGMQAAADAWETWFQTNFPATERFLYLIDESHDYAQIEQWANWIQNSPGPGKNLMSLATVWINDAISHVPSLDIITSTMYVAPKDTTERNVNSLKNRADKKFYLYNGGRPGQGSFELEDEGVALRQLPWAQYKKGIDRWFYWESTYYNNFQGNEGETNVFRQAHTFGTNSQFDNTLGETGWNYSNGDGVLFYPGTEKVFVSDSYNIPGPMASLRLKYWRRGIQDTDYLALAHQKNPQRTAQIIQQTVPKVLWEYDVTDQSDPTWVKTDISWSTNPDVWENARKELANIIAN